MSALSSFRRRLMIGAYPKEQPNYLCFTALEDNSTIGKTGTYSVSLEYSLNGRTWNPFDNSTTINLNAGEKAYFRGDNTSLASSDSVCTTFVITGKVEGSGNIMSLLYSNNFDTHLSLTAGNEFRCLFLNCAGLVTPPELPATQLTGWSSYEKMFKGCTSLISAPDLPAENFSRSCCQSMFEGCTSLLVAPAINVRSVAQNAMTSMFDGCTSLATAGDVAINITGANIESLKYMFRNCTSLSTPPSALKSMSSARGSFYGMFYGCSSLVTLPDMYFQMVYSDGAREMFEGCTSLDGVVDLSFVTSMNASYQMYRMFKGCVNITKAILPTLQNVPADAYGNMFDGCLKLNYVIMLSLTIASIWSLAGWLNNVASSGIFVKHIDATWTGNVPSNWTVIYYDPALDKYYLDQQRATECDDHGNPI